MYNILIFTDDENLLNTLDIKLSDINFIVVSTKKLNITFNNIVVNKFSDIFTLSTDIFNDKPIAILKNPYLLEYNFLTLLKQLELNNTKIISMPDPQNSLMRTKLVDLINQNYVTNDEAINIYKNLKQYNYNFDFKGIFLDYLIGFLNIDEYNKFRKLLNIFKDINDISILYTYVLNTYYNKYEVVPCSIKMIDERIDYNYAYFYNEIEPLVY